jgi:glycosyltransferase EpsD
MACGEGADFDVPFEKKLFSPKNTEARRQIRKIVNEGSFDAILLNTTLAAFHVRLAIRKKDRPRVVNLAHGFLFTGDVGFLKSKLLYLCEKLVARRTDAVIVMNAEDAAIAKRKKLGTKVYCVRGMGVPKREVTRTPDEVRQELGVADRFIMCFVGEISGRKNQEFMIRALPKIKESIPSTALVLVGEGAEKENLCKISDELGISDSVIFTGKRSDAQNFMNAADVYVSASKIEGLPFNVVEALSCGCKIVASKIKGHTDVLEGARGLLYECGSQDSFVKCVIAAHDGSFSPSKESLIERFEAYSTDRVQEGTLTTMKEALDL